MQFKDYQIPMQQLIDEVFRKINLLKNYKLINVKVFDELFKEELEIIDMTEFISDVTRYTFNVRQLNKIKV